jgi:hypothetical protein
MNYNLLIRDDIECYTGDLIHSRFAYKLLRNKVLPHGNIVAFRAPMLVEADGMIDLEDVLSNDFIYSKDAINFCWEIPNLEAFGAVAFQRLLNTQIANILYNIIKKPIEVNGDDLLVVDEFEGSDGQLHSKGKCSVSITYVKNGAALGHTGINIDAGNKAPGFAYSTHLTQVQIQEFMHKVIDMFTQLVDSIFVATTKVIA